MAPSCRGSPDRSKLRRLRDDLERRTGRVLTHRRDRSVAVCCLVLCDSQDRPTRRFDDHHHRLILVHVHGTLSSDLNVAVQTDTERRNRLRRSLGQHIGVDAVLVDRDDTPAGFAVDLVDDRLLDLPEKVGRELRVRRDEIRFVRDRYSRDGSQLRRYLVVVVTAQAGHQIVALDGRRRFGDRLTRQRRIEPTENTCEIVCGTNDVVALGAIELHSVDNSRHQDIRARMLVDPRSRAAVARNDIVCLSPRRG